MKIICAITARKGSKGIKNKNIVKIHNKPLIEFTLQAASKSVIKNNIYILTDSNKIKNLAKKYSMNTSYIRPKHTSNDKSSTISTLKHFSDWYLKENNYDAIITLQPTSPLRSYYDIDASINIFKKNKYASLSSISNHLEHPYDAVNLKKKSKLEFVIKKRVKFPRRQDFDINSYFKNGAIFISTKKLINQNKMFDNSNHGFYKMPKIRSIEIDELEDLEIVKKLLK